MTTDDCRITTPHAHSSMDDPITCAWRDQQARRRMIDVIKASIDKAEYGYHELTDTEAAAVVVAVYEWCRDYHHIDLLEFRG